jgi:hypothetical protein
VAITYTDDLVPHHLSSPCHVSEAIAADQTTFLFPRNVFHLRELCHLVYEAAESDRDRLGACIGRHETVRLAVALEMGDVDGHDRMSFAHSCRLHGEAGRENEDGEKAFFDHRHSCLYLHLCLDPSCFLSEELETSPSRDAEVATLNGSRPICFLFGSSERVWVYPLLLLNDVQNQLQSV